MQSQEAIGVASELDLVELSGANKQSIDFCFAHWWLLSGSLLSIYPYHSYSNFISTFVPLCCEQFFGCTCVCCLQLGCVMGRSVPFVSWEGLNVTWACFSCVLHKDSFTRFPKQRNWDGNGIRRFRFMSVNDLCLIRKIFRFGCGCICA